MGTVQSLPVVVQARANAQPRYRFGDTVKLIALTAGWAMIQWVRGELDKSHRRWLQSNSHELPQAGSRNRQGGSQRQEEWGLFDLCPHRLRNVSLEWIDQYLMPAIIDRWREKLVEVFLGDAPIDPQASEGVSIIPRHCLLESLKNLQEQITLISGSGAAVEQGARVPLQSTFHRLTLPSPSLFLPAKEPESPSAPSLTQHFHVEPSAPPLPQDQAAATTRADGVDATDYECAICMESCVNVEIQRCHHKMCVECAKAVVCMENQNPACPFCRGPIDEFRLVPGILDAA
eukprot:jgi/Botrbrau1/21007/Bobra.0144s0023.1